MAARSLIFAQPLWFAAILLAAALAVGLWYGSRRLAFRRVSRFFTARLAVEVLAAIRWNEKKWRFASAVAVLALFATALARPLVGPREDSGERKGADLVILLDVSKSMWVEDVEPNRLEAVKASLIQWIQKQKSDRIGLILFAGEAYVQAPLTFDYNALSFVLEQASPRSISAKGSNLPKAIETATAMLSHNEVQSKIVLIVSDGEVEGDAITAARTAHTRDGITLFTVGVGTPGGGRVPSFDRRKESKPPPNSPPFVKNEFGGEVTSRLESQTLRALAGVGGGEYYEWKAGEPTFEILREKSLMPLVEKTRKIEAKNYDEWFQVPLGLAILVLLLEPLFFRIRKETTPMKTGVPIVQPATHSRRPKIRVAKKRGKAAMASLFLLLLSLAVQATEKSLPQVESLLASGKKEEAVAFMRAVVEKNPTDAYASYNLGLVLVRAGKPGEAVPVFEAVQGLSEDAGLRAKAAFQIGNVHLAEALRLKEDRGAGVTCVRALESAIGYYDMQQTIRATKESRHNSGLAGQELETVLLAIGKERTRANTEKTLREALQAYERATELNTEHQPLVDQARQLLSDKLAESAETLDKRADEMEAREAAEGKNGDKALEKILETRQEALGKLQEGSDLAPGDKPISDALKDQQQKISQLLTRMAKRKADPILKEDRNFYSSGSFRDLEEASSRLDQALTLDPENPEAQELGQKVKDELLEGHLTNGELALKHLRKSGDAAGKLSNAQQVQKEFTAALALDPDNQLAKNGLAEVEPMLADLYAAVGEQDLEAAKTQLGAAGTPPPKGPEPNPSSGESADPASSSPSSDAGSPSPASPPSSSQAAGKSKPSESALRNSAATLEKSLNNLNAAAGLKPEDAKIGESLKEAEGLMASVRDQLAQMEAAKGSGEGPGEGIGEAQEGGGEEGQGGDPKSGSGGSMMSMSSLRGKAGAGGAGGGDSKRYWEKYVRDW
jgi:Ca-activated chloride channel family protein